MMRRAPRALVAAAVACAAGGCAYFNAMYNAERYAHLAESNERLGRLTDARSAWQQAAAHAESLVVHHPRSGWVGKAQLLRGRALERVQDYSGAQVALQQALRQDLSRDERLQALGLLGHLALVYQKLDSAAVDLDSAAASPDRAVRDAALLDRGRVWLALGRPDSAGAAFARSRHPDAPFARAAVEVGLGDTAAAGAAYDSLARVKGVDEAAWRPALDSLAAAGGAAHASALAARLAGRRDCPTGTAARLLLDEGARRLAAGDSAGAAAAWERVQQVAADSVEGQAAAVSLIRLGLASATSDSALADAQARLEQLSHSGGSAGRDAADLLALLRRVGSLMSADQSAPDAHWFLRAEVVRDSLGARRLAAEDFAAMASRFPESPWTPKALVAAIAAGFPDADSLQGLLLHRYAGSPYAVAAVGGAAHGDSLAALEDSLRTVLAFRPPVRGGPGIRVGGRIDRGEAARRPQGDEGEEEPGARRAGQGQAPAEGPVVRPAAPAPAPIVPPSRPPYGPPGPEPPQ